MDRSGGRVRLLRQCGLLVLEIRCDVALTVKEGAPG